MGNLEERFLAYAKAVRNFCSVLKWDIINQQYIRQVIRSSGSIIANYTEAQDNLGKADERMKLKTARREAKETICWLELLFTYENESHEKERLKLIVEGNQIKLILSSILIKLGN